MPKTINVSTKKFPAAVVIVDDEDFERLNVFRWSPRAGGKTVYATRQEGSRLIHMHHEIIGKPPAGKMIDHHDGNGLNNTSRNLRFADRAENAANTGKFIHGTTSKYKGVCYAKARGKWNAQIMVRGVKRNLGYFDVEEVAARTFDAVAFHHLGKFARLNFQDPAPCPIAFLWIQPRGAR